MRLDDQTPAVVYSGEPVRHVLEMEVIAESKDCSEFITSASGKKAQRGDVPLD
ncbi:hypothetical protein [Fundidesulfovibrio soli]|uniref:hypothetical protein n=1 Tax=Fundidesulfovibrio soli TaxID=2922716 RepID=UPI001FAF9CF9|nr:hypothetical protein [Fundidesulfovibrio soli]